MLKPDAPLELIDTLDRIENTADECWRALRLLDYPSDVASWALLTRAVQVVEQRRAHVQPNTASFGAMLANLSRAVAIGLKWTGQHTMAAEGEGWTFDPGLAQAADQAIAVGHQYAQFEVCFQGFHKNLSEVELLAANRVRFATPGSPRYRQVRAFQQYSQLRPAPLTAGSGLPALETQHIRDLLATAVNAGRTVSPGRFAYEDPWELWREMFPRMRARLGALTRRADNTSLGPFTLREFGDAYAAILTVVSTHDYVCFAQGRFARTYPMESAVAVRTRTAWRELLSELSGVTPSKCDAVLVDLLFDKRSSTDLHIHPIVQIDTRSDLLAIAPPFPMHANHEENILRVCSRRRKTAFDAISGEKEGEMQAALRPYLGQLLVRESVG